MVCGGGDRDKRDLVAAIECGPLCGVTGLRGCWLRRKVQFYQLCDGCSPGGYYANFGMACDWTTSPFHGEGRNG